MSNQIKNLILLRDEVMAAVKKAAMWDKLIELAGHWQDGSCETVKLGWDDATRTAFIQVGKKSYYKEGCGFEAALEQVPDEITKGDII